MDGATTPQGSKPVREDKVLAGAPLVMGHPIVGKHALLDRLGAGAMGSVYLAYQLSVSRLEAVKFLDPQGDASADLVRRFRHEAQAMANLESPNIVKVYDVDSWAGRHYLSMELIDGETISGRVRRSGKLGHAEAATIARDAAFGLATIHDKQIIHRDIKPANILMTARGVVKVSDLGVAKNESADSAMHTGTHTIIGTPQYMAPEQFNGQVTPQSDIYALGLTLRYMVGGYDPVPHGQFTAIMRKVTDGLEHPGELHDNLPDGLAEIMHKATAKEPGDRYEDARAFAAALDAWLREEGGAVDLEKDSPSVLGDRLPAAAYLREIETEAEALREKGSGGIGEAATIVPKTANPIPPTIPGGSAFPQTIPDGGSGAGPGDAGGSSGWGGYGPPGTPGSRPGPIPTPLPAQGRDSGGFPAWMGVLLGLAAVAAVAVGVIVMTGEKSPVGGGTTPALGSGTAMPTAADEAADNGGQPSIAREESTESDEQDTPRDKEQPLVQGDPGGRPKDGSTTGEHEAPVPEGAGTEHAEGPGESVDPGDGAPQETEEERRRVARLAELAEEVNEAKERVRRAESMADPVAAIEALAGVMESLSEAEAEAEELEGSEAEQILSDVKVSRSAAEAAADKVMGRVLSEQPSERAEAMFIDGPELAEQMLGIAEAGSNNTLRVLIGSLQWYPDTEAAEITENAKMRGVLARAHDLAVERGLEGALFHRGEYKRLLGQGSAAYADYRRGYRLDPRCKWRMAFLLLGWESGEGAEIHLADEIRRAGQVIGLPTGTPEERNAAAVSALEKAVRSGSHRASRLLAQELAGKGATRPRAVDLLVDSAASGNSYSIGLLRQWAALKDNQGRAVFTITDEHQRRLRRSGINL